MRPSLSTISLHHLPLDGALDWAERAGFRYLELMMLPGGLHLEPGTMSPGRLSAELQRRGLRLAVVHGGGLDGTSQALLEASLHYLERLVPFIAAAGAPMLNINGMPVPVGATPPERSAMLERIVAGLRRLEPLVLSHGLAVTLENHHRCHIEQPGDYAQIFQAFPHDSWLGATIDTGHCQRAGVDALALARVLGRRVMHIHLKDHRGAQAVMLGKGEIDNLSLLRALRGSGYHGFLSAELELADAAAQQRGVMAALPYMEHLVAQSAMAVA